MRVIVLLLLGAAAATMAGNAGLSAVVQKPSVEVHSQPDFAAPTVVTLNRNAPVQIAAQQGLWYKLALPGGGVGYVRVNDVRVAHSTAAASGDTARVLFTGKAGKGRITETAGVRGIDESDLRSAAFDAGQLAKMEMYRATPKAAAAQARINGWLATGVAFAGEGRPSTVQVKQADAQRTSSAGRGILRSLGRGALASVLGVSEKAIPKAEQELAEEELALGPEIAGRVLGARPLWNDDAAQRRINLIGRWMASQTTRPELPWTFGVVDTPEINAFAAPGGYVLVTRGLYELVDSDAELAGVLGHEINHIVQRDHYAVIRKQGLAAAGGDVAMGQVNAGSSIGGSLAKSYVSKHGAAIMLTGLDRNAEYRSDEAAQIYLARSGMNPLALYSILQKMAALGGATSGLAQLYKTHPPLDERLDRIDSRGHGGLEPYTLRD
ncbi:M48 family metalloprotease [Lysobacter sp. CFH 32150]|uniref:M48 family metalloprotease n=1 Tax=Lysobacter sp. CFH 32150 TaxID=2927128 RepID=UPI001FA6D7DA|nr:M48 family metalloprotease [Lysobacter sp. CFH 32150]MCI4566857.1 M48 family metalloprotease [Lysobacter sp. CFH 32150]